MNINIERAQVLIEELPYIQKYYKKTVVIKYGGNAMTTCELKRAVISDIVLLSLVGINVVVVHGGGPEISEMVRKIGKEPKFVNGLRYTDSETMEIVQGVLCGKVNKDLVATIIRKGGSAIGLCGIDGSMIEARRMRRDDGEDYGLVGDITKINPSAVQKAIEDNSIPVVATVAIGIDAETSYNVNADTAASRLAIALGAEKLIILTDTRGVLRDPKDDATLIHVIRRNEISDLLANGVISGGMIPKIECCADAIDGGVKRTHILDGRIPHSILIEMLTDEGAGTMVL